MNKILYLVLLLCFLCLVSCKPKRQIIFVPPTPISIEKLRVIYAKQYIQDLSISRTFAVDSAGDGGRTLKDAYDIACKVFPNGHKYGVHTHDSFYDKNHKAYIVDDNMYELVDSIKLESDDPFRCNEKYDVYIIE